MLQSLVGFGQNSFLIDVISGERLYFKPASIHESIQLGNKQFVNFRLIDSTLDSNKNHALKSYFQSFYENDTINDILKNYDKGVMDSLNRHERVNNEFIINTIQLDPISYLNHEIYFQHTLGFRTSEGYKELKYIKMYYSYNIKTEHISDLNNVKQKINSKNLFKAIQKKWDNLLPSLAIDGHKSLFTKYGIKIDTNESYNGLYENVTTIIQSQDLNTLDLYWTGAGLMIRLKEAFVSKKKEQFIPIQIHLDLNELPKDCMKFFGIPKSTVNEIKHTPIYNFSSRFTIPSIQKDFLCYNLDLLKVSDKDIKQLEISNNQNSNSKQSLKSSYVYDDGFLIKRIQNSNDTNGLVDSILWTNNRCEGYITRFKNTKQKQKSWITKYDNHNNKLAYYSIEENIDIKRCVYFKNIIVAFPYSIFDTSQKNHLTVSFYEKNSNGWIYSNAYSKIQESYIYKNNRPSIIGEQTYIYNMEGYIAQHWKGNSEFTLYHYNKDNHLNEVIHRYSGKFTEYQYKYSDFALVKEISVYQSKMNVLQTYYFKWMF